MLGVVVSHASMLQKQSGRTYKKIWSPTTYELYKNTGSCNQETVKSQYIINHKQWKHKSDLSRYKDPAWMQREEMPTPRVLGLVLFTTGGCKFIGGCGLEVAMCSFCSALEYCLNLFRHFYVGVLWCAKYMVVHTSPNKITIFHCKIYKLCTSSQSTY